MINIITISKGYLVLIQTYVFVVLKVKKVVLLIWA